MYTHVCTFFYIHTCIYIIRINTYTCIYIYIRTNLSPLLDDHVLPPPSTAAATACRRGVWWSFGANGETRCGCSCCWCRLREKCRHCRSESWSIVFASVLATMRSIACAPRMPTCDCVGLPQMHVRVLCMCVCVCVRVCECVQLVRANADLRLWGSLLKCEYVCMCMCVCVCVYTACAPRMPTDGWEGRILDVCVRACVCVCTRARVLCVCVRVLHTHTHTYTHTHTHTHTQTRTRSLVLRVNIW